MTEHIKTGHVAHLIPAHVAGTLQPAEQQRVVAHLANCPQCRAERAAWEAIQDAVRDTAEAVPEWDAVMQRVWNRLDAETARGVLTGRPLETDAVGPTTQDLIDRLWLGGVPLQAADAQTRAWQRLRHESAQEEDPMETTPLAATQRLTPWSLDHPNGQIASPPSPHRMHSWWRGINGMVATAALVVLMLAATLFTAGPLRSSRVVTAPTGGPAGMMALATPGPTEAVREVLVETTVPADALPAGQNREVMIWQATIQPGAQITVPVEWFACCPGSMIEHVLEGELALRVDGPLQVMRAGTPGAVEEVAQGTEVVLQVGDTAIYDKTLPAEYANHGAEPVQLAVGGLFGGSVPAPPSGYRVNNHDAASAVDAPLAGPITFRLERVTLVPGAMLPPPPPSALRVVTSGPSIDYLPEAADGSITNLVRDPVEAYVLTLLPAGAEAGTPQATPTA